MLLVWNGQMFLWKNGINAEFPHDVPYHFSAFFYAIFMVKRRQHSSLTTGRIFRIKFVNLIYQITLLLRNDGPVIEVATAYSEHGTLANDRHPVVF